MTPAEWAEVFEAGALAVPNWERHSTPQALGLALDAMARKCREIAKRAPP